MTIKRRGIKFDRKKKQKEGEIVKQNQLKKMTPNKNIAIKRTMIKFNKLSKIKKVIIKRKMTKSKKPTN
jgi:sporulation protein YlmC with PRC-barrel domain